MNVFISFLNLTGMLIWLFPPLRQYGTRFFIFFLMYGFADWLGILYNMYIDHSTNHLVYILISFAAYISLQDKENLKKNIWFHTTVLLLSLIIFIYAHDILTSAVILVMFHILITISLLRLLLDKFFNEGIFIGFVGIMIFYEFTTFSKLATLLTGFNNNYVYFGITTAIQIILGLFFSIFKYDNKRFFLQLK